MAKWELTIQGKGLRKAAVEKLAAKMKDEFGEGAAISVRDATPPESRADRFAAALGNVTDGRSEIESLRDELQEWYDNLPENFQNGDKGSDLTDAIDELETLIGNLEEAEGTDVSFPAMFS